MSDASNRALSNWIRALPGCNADDKREEEEEEEEELRWNRAASWAREQSVGPNEMGIDPPECGRIEALRDRILEIGWDAAWDERQRPDTP